MKFTDLDLSKRYTYADYLTWTFPERVELIFGKIFQMTPAPSTGHQRASMYLGYEIYGHLKGRICEVFDAPFDVRLPPSSGTGTIDTVVQPDLCVYCDPEQVDERGGMGPPDWVIEILSPSTAAKDRRDKFRLYERAGVPEYWMVHIGKRKILVYRLTEEGTYQGQRPFIKGDVIRPLRFPGLDIEVGEVFPDPDLIEEPWAAYARKVEAAGG